MYCSSLGLARPAVYKTLHRNAPRGASDFVRRHAGQAVNSAIFPKDFFWLSEKGLAWLASGQTGKK
jgi:hypothetical protein